MWFSPDGCTGWHCIKHHFSAKPHSISGASDILFISSRGAGSKVRTERVPLRSGGNGADGPSRMVCLPLMRACSSPEQTNCQWTEVLVEGSALACDTDSAYPLSQTLPTIQFHHWPLLQKWRSPLWPGLRAIPLILTPELRTPVPGYILFSYPF